MTHPDIDMAAATAAARDILRDQVDRIEQARASQPARLAAARTEADEAREQSLLIEPWSEQLSALRAHTRDGQPTPVNKGTGLVGYPAIADGGVQLVSLFNPLIAIGRRIKVESIFTRANGEWTVSQLQHELDSETVGGKWFTNISGRHFDFKEEGSTNGG